MTPTARSMKWLRDRGFIVCRVEQRLHMPKSPFPITKDAFGFGDLLAADPARCEIYLVQVTSTGNLNKRCEKIHTDPKVSTLALQWLQAGGSIWVHGWAKRGARGKPKRWSISRRKFYRTADQLCFCEDLS